MLFFVRFICGFLIDLQKKVVTLHSFLYMGRILEYIQQSGNGKFQCYNTKKLSLDVNDNDIIAYSYDDNHSFSNFEFVRWNNLRANYKNVVGVYEIKHREGTSVFAVWYLRLRNSDFRETSFSDIVKCEMVLLQEEKPIDTDIINVISANLIREAYPVCFGSDTRWANHLYPVYLTDEYYFLVA